MSGKFNDEFAIGIDVGEGGDDELVVGGLVGDLGGGGEGGGGDSENDNDNHI